MEERFFCGCPSRRNGQHTTAKEFRVCLPFSNKTTYYATIRHSERGAVYFPIHYMEPIIGNEKAIDLDYHAPGSRQQTVLSCMNQGRPSLTDRLRLVQETEAIAYGVVLMHPGVELSTQNDVWPKDLASIVIRIPDLLKRDEEDQEEDAEVYLYDNDDSRGSPLFFGRRSCP
jgi:CHASE1-domain containing sensor protein